MAWKWQRRNENEWKNDENKGYGFHNWIILVWNGERNILGLRGSKQKKIQNKEMAKTQGRSVKGKLNVWRIPKKKSENPIS